MTSAPRAEGQPSKLCIDLGSGLGGASVAFKEAGWDDTTEQECFKEEFR